MKYLRGFNEEHILTSFGDSGSDHFLPKLGNIERDDLEIGSIYKYHRNISKNNKLMARVELIEIDESGDKFSFRVVKILTPQLANTIGFGVGDIIMTKGADISKNFSLK